MVQVTTEIARHIATALHGDTQALQGVTLVYPFDARFDAQENTKGSKGGGIPAAAHVMGEAGDMGVSWWTMIMSLTVVPTSSPVIYSPPRVWMNRPMARSSTSVLSVRGWPRITAWPPPYLTSATAAL